MKFGFVTCVQLGLSCMEAIYEIGGSLDFAVTLKDTKAVDKSGRVYLDDFCAGRGVDLIKIDHVNDPAVIGAARDVDWLFIIGWSQIAGRDVLEAPRRGVLGMHPTLLPVGRGRAAIPWAILKGLNRTGVTLFRLDEGVDTGPVAGRREILLSGTTTATELYQWVNAAHVRLMRDVFPSLDDGTVQFEAQDEGLATVWPGRRPEDGEIDLRGTAASAERLIRAVTRPYPGAYFYDGSGRKVIVWSSKQVPEQPPGPFLEFEDGFLALLDTETG